MRASNQKLKATGLANHKLVEAALRLKFFCYVNENSTIDEVKYFLHLGLPVIVNYTEPYTDGGHFAVVSGYRRLSKRLVLHDPYLGKNYHITEKEFTPRWHGEFQSHNRWMMVISKKPFTIGKHYKPHQKIS
jgi:hypothetical protein